MVTSCLASPTAQDGSRLSKPFDVGQFDIKRIPRGRWNLKIIDTSADAGSRLATRRLAAAVNAGFVTDLGAIRLSCPGQIGGRVMPGANVPFAIISVPSGMAIRNPAAS